MVSMLMAIREIEEFENFWRAREQIDFHRALLLLEDLIDLARRLGVWPGSDPLAGIEVDVRLAKVINAARTP
jgi:hypothetical protein